MTTAKLIRSSLAYYWRTNLAVVSGVAAAVAVLAGALMVGESVRASLRELAVGRLGNTEVVISGAHFFRERLAEELSGACPLIVLDGMVIHQGSGRRAARVAVYGVDERFWRFHGKRDPGLSGRDAGLSVALAQELGAQPGETLLLRVSRHSDIPAESLQGRKEDAAATVRLKFRRALPGPELGEFSLRPHQGEVRALFVPLRLLQEDLELPARINTMLAGSGTPDPGGALARHAQLEDLGIRVTALKGTGLLQVESAAGLLSDTVAGALRSTAAAMRMRQIPLFTYLANSIEANGRRTPYSLVTAMDLSALPGLARRQFAPDAVVLTDWAARDLQARPGQEAAMEFYLWKSEGTLATARARFRVAAVVPLDSIPAGRRLAPDYPGMTDSSDIDNWDPPFPVDLSRIRDKDEDYWDRYRATPKAFVPLERGQSLWASRYGRLSAVRLEGDVAVEELAAALRARLDPWREGFQLSRVRQQSLEASRGATDFGAYFVYFSFFLMVSALLLAALFFRLGVEQRVREVGLLEAAGFTARQTALIFALEAVVLAAAGAILGLAGALLYGELMVHGLRTWWSGAMGTSRIVLRISPTALLEGAGGGLAAALLAMLWTLRSLRRAGPRTLLSGAAIYAGGLSRAPSARLRWLGTAALLGGLLGIGASFTGAIAPAGGFFGAGACLLIAALVWLRILLPGSGALLVGGHGASGLLRLARRNTGCRPGRSILSIALIASATFLVVAVESFRRDEGGGRMAGLHSGSGGYPLMAESALPLYYDPNSASGREAYNLAGMEHVRFLAFRLRPGDDTSCLNLYQPKEPRILGAPAEFLRQSRFRFAGSMARTEPQRRNPWLLLQERFPDGAVPAIGDASSLTYVLHKKLGEEIVLPSGPAGGVRLRLVGALADSIFQGELLVSEEAFLRHFPQQEGYRFFLIEAPHQAAEALSGELEQALADQGFDVTSTSERLAAFHRVENTYLSTFQMLGGLGLLLGSLGLAAVLIRNVMERRRELALLAALGFPAAAARWVVLAEHLALLVAGLLAGVVSATIAIWPALSERGFQASWSGMALLLAAVLASGALASAAAAALAMRGPLLDALRAE